MKDITQLKRWNRMPNDFEMCIVYNAPIGLGWKALTDENDMRMWYFPQLKYFKLVVGFKFVFTNDGSAYQKEWVVTKVADGRLLAHSWVYKGYKGGSEVVFELFEEGDKTKLKLTHTGLSSFPKESHFAKKRFEDGWKQILGINFRNHLANNPRA